MKVLNLTDNLSIKEEKNILVYKIIITNDLINSSLIEFHNYLGNEIRKALTQYGNVCFELISDAGVKRVDMVNIYYSFLSIFVKNGTLKEEKFEEHRLFPRTEISSQLNATDNIMIALLNRKSLFNEIQIKAIWKNKTILELV